jgi:hypothetical protein
MKNKLMMLTMALVAMSNVMNANSWDIARLPHTFNYTSLPYTDGNGVTYYSRQHRDNLLASKTAEFFNMQRQAQNLLSSQPKSSIAQNIAASKARKVSQQAYKLSHVNVLSSFENEGGKVLGGQIIGKASKVTINPKMVAAGLVGSTIAGAGVYAYNKYSQPKIEKVLTEQTPVEKHVANVVMTNIAKNKTVQSTKFERVKNALNNAGSLVTSNVQAHKYIATGAGLATVAGLSALAYKKGLFGKVAIKFGLKKETKRK